MRCPDHCALHATCVSAGAGADEVRTVLLQRRAQDAHEDVPGGLAQLERHPRHGALHAAHHLVRHHGRVPLERLQTTNETDYLEQFR